MLTLRQAGGSARADGEAVTLRKGHGDGAGVPRIEVLPADELPEGVQVLPPKDASQERRTNGTLKQGATHVPSLGGKAKKQRVALAAGLGLKGAETSPEFVPYRRAAVAFRRVHCGALARSVGGGFCGAGPSSIVASAALQLSASRYLFDLAGKTSDPALFQQASRLANDSRQNLLAAHELCAREAKQRPTNPHAQLAEALEDGAT